jgi:hypothetical protein
MLNQEDGKAEEETGVSITSMIGKDAEQMRSGRQLFTSISTRCTIDAR